MSNLVDIGSVNLEKMIFKFLHLNKLEPTSPENTCQVEFRPLGSGKENFLISSMIFRLFLISHLWKMLGPSYEKFWIPFTKEYFVPNLVKTGLSRLFLLFCYFLTLKENKAFKETWISFTQGCFVHCLVVIITIFVLLFCYYLPFTTESERYTDIPLFCRQT